MSADRNTKFRRLLSNERSFDRLFCDVKSSKDFDFYYNSCFSEDTLFNHAVVSEQILADSTVRDGDAIFSLLEEIKNESQSRNLPSTIFVEKIWENSEFLERNAIEAGFVVSGSMNVLSKVVSQNHTQISQGLEISETDDFGLWNETFMRAYSIDSKWRDELMRRLKMLSEKQDTSLFLAIDRQREAAGCMLMHRTPQDLMGMYCVGTVPERRNQGIASQMIEKANDYAASMGCEELTLQTIVADDTTRLYLRHGYNVAFDRDVLQLR